MKLANLAYEVVRDAIKIDGGINFDVFIRGDYDSDRDYSSQISFAFNYINLAFSRLLTSKKTLLKLTDAVSDDNGYIDFDDGEITAIVSEISPLYEKVAFHNYQNGVAIEKKYVGKTVFIEYRAYIPHFDIESIRHQTLDDDNEETYEEVEIDLKDYGITDEMCSYVKEYAIGGLTEYLSPELSQRHIQMAESYFSALKTRYTEYPQRKIEDKFGGDW